MKRAHCLLQELGSQLRSLQNGTNCPGQILIVDEEGGQYWEDLAAILPECRFTSVACPGTAKRHFLSSPTDLIVLNHSPHISCLQLLPQFKSLRPSVPIIVTTARGSEEFAVEVFRHGAIDYIKKPFDIEDLELKIRAILEIRRWHKEPENPQPGSGLPRALCFIEANFNSPLTLSQTALEAGMSISCFEKRLKNKTGMTFTTFVNALRVAKAKEMILKEWGSMLQVSLACGFNNQAHFNRVFKKIAGLSPREYRKSILFS